MSLDNVSKIAILGGGKMGGTLARALVASELVRAEQIVVTTAHELSLERFSDLPSLSTTLDNRSAVEGADVVLLCVKPQKVGEVLEEIRPALRPGQLLLSIAAGVTLAMLEEGVEVGTAVVRAMPNTPRLSMPV